VCGLCRYQSLGTSLLYFIVRVGCRREGCEGWTLYRHHILKLDQFHLRCLRKIAHIKWQEHVPNTTVLKICNISGIEALLQTAQLRWCGHVIRMDNTRIPKQLFYGQLHHGFRRSGGQYKRYKDCLNSTMTQCGITPSELETLAMDRAGWRFTCKSAVVEFEVRRRPNGICANLVHHPPATSSARSATTCVTHGLGFLPTTSHSRDDETRRIDGSVHEDVVVKQFTFAVSSADELLVLRSNNLFN